MQRFSGLCISEPPYKILISSGFSFYRRLHSSSWCKKKHVYTAEERFYIGMAQLNEMGMLILINMSQIQEKQSPGKIPP